MINDDAVSRKQRKLKNYVAVSVSVYTPNAQTKCMQHKWIAKPKLREKAAPPGQFITLQAFNTFKETLSGYVTKSSVKLHAWYLWVNY